MRGIHVISKLLIDTTIMIISMKFLDIFVSKSELSGEKKFQLLRKKLNCKKLNGD